MKKQPELISVDSTVESDLVVLAIETALTAFAEAGDAKAIAELIRVTKSNSFFMEIPPLV